MFDRGFKNWSERTSRSIRKQLGLKTNDPLSPFELANHLKISLLTPDKITGLSEKSRHQLLVADSGGWSATSLQIRSTFIVIYNSSHLARRQNSDIMHEIAHIIIKHEPSRVILIQDGSIVMRSYDNKQENEASWLSGCLLLPRDGMVWAKNRGLLDQAICNHFKVSQPLLNWRLNVSGILKQVQRRKKF